MHSRRRRLARAPEGAGLPEWASKLWSESLTWQRADVERAVLRGIDAAVDHIRRSTLLIEGDGASKFATGAAAYGIVDVDANPEDPTRPRLGAQALVIAVEHSDGTVVAPRWPVAIEPEIASEANDRACRTLAARLVSLGYAVDEPGREPPRPKLVGREGAWVPDPLDKHRNWLGEDAQALDDEATLSGEEIAREDDDALRRRRRRVSTAFDGISPERKAQRPYRAARLAEALSNWFAAEEDARVLDGRMLTEGPSGELMSAAEALRNRLHDRRTPRQLELPEAAWPPVQHDEQLGLSSSDWDKAIELIAVERELAIRAEERAQRASAGVPRGPPPPGAKLIGRGDVTAAVDRRRRALHRELEGEFEDLGVRIVERHEVSAPQVLDQLKDVIGERRAQLLAARAEPLRAWLADSSIRHWVLERNAQMGDPEAFLDRRAARFWRLNEAAQVRVSSALADAIAKEARLDGELREVERREVARHRKALERLQLQSDVLRAQGHDLDDWLARDGDRVVRTIAYRDEVAIGGELEIAQEAEWAVIDPPEYLEELIGPAPDKDLKEHLRWAAEWEELARGIERARLGAEADRPTGDQRHALDRAARRELDERIDRVRAARAMEPRQPGPALEATTAGPALDGPA